MDGRLSASRNTRESATVNAVVLTMNLPAGALGSDDPL
jgi:hypothetical protein